MRLRGTSFSVRLIPASGKTEVLFDDLAALLVVGVQPAANSLGRKASIRERVDERTSWAQHVSHVSKHLYGSGEVVDGNAAHHGVEGLVGKWQPGLGVEVVDDAGPCRGVRVSSSEFIPSAVRRTGGVRKCETHELIRSSTSPEIPSSSYRAPTAAMACSSRWVTRRRHE